MFLPKKLLALYSKSYKLHFNLPNNRGEYLLGEAFKLKRLIKFFKRYFYLWWWGQLTLEKSSIAKEMKTILWINTTAPSLGDSLMDLSGRVLISDKHLDLYTDPKNSLLYANDAIFQQVFDQPESLTGRPYDFILIDSFSPRSFNLKLKYFPHTPFAGLYGFLNGFDLNRTLFSYYRIAELFEVNLNNLENLAKPSLTISPTAQATIANFFLPEDVIAIAVGGEWDFRTFDRWTEVIDLLYEKGERHIVLVGSSNGLKTANQILNKYPTLWDFVGQLSLSETVAVLAKSKVVLCADGGILHLANAIDKPTVSLFASIHPQLRLTQANLSIPLYDDISVKNISANAVFTAYKKLIESIPA
jgi:heptosyltransferase-2